MKRCRENLGALVGAVFCSLANLAGAQPAMYPNMPIQLIAQQPPGSASDAMTRAWADCAARELGQPVVVLNKPGANGLLAINALKAQPADGYSLMTIGMSQMTITPYVYKQPPYDPIHDFDSVAVLGSTPLVLAVPAGQGVTRLAQLAEQAKVTEGGINFGSPGKGSPAHLLTSALLNRMGVPGTHVPFVGEGAGLTALMGRQIHAMTLVIGTAVPQAKSGKLVPLVVFGPQRSPLLPDVPTIGEAFPAASDLARTAWIAVVARAGTPTARLEVISAANEKCRSSDAAYRSRMEAVNVSLVGSAPGDAAAWAARDTAVWKPLIEKLGLATE